MPVITRARAKQIQEDEFARLRNIQTDYVYEHSITVTTRSVTGLGFHRRWVYSDTMLPALANTNSDLILQDHVPLKGELQMVQEKGEWSRSSTLDRAGSEDNDSHTPESSFLATPSPKPISRQRVLADADMKFLLHIKRGEDVEEAVSRHIELYV